MSSKHFEDLWNKCEGINNLNSNASSKEIIEELKLKIELYKLIDSKSEISKEDQQKLKSRTLGEILFTLTNLSLKDNINVYEALSSAITFRN